jgi:hypothetical protein
MLITGVPPVQRVLEALIGRLNVNEVVQIQSDGGHDDQSTKRPGSSKCPTAVIPTRRVA